MYNNDFNILYLSVYNKCMSSILFDKIIFGPVYSRRLGMSLGINLLPPDKKVCTFDCFYCECGLTYNRETNIEEMPSRKQVKMH